MNKGFSFIDHKNLPFDIPEEPSYDIDWIRLREVFPNFFAEMEKTEQDPRWHAEGNVLEHTKRVCKCLVSYKEYKSLSYMEKQTVFTAAVLHDIGKIKTTVKTDEGISSPNHTSVGAKMAREFLWKNFGLGGIPGFMRWRESVCQLIRLHGKPPFFWTKASTEDDSIKAERFIYQMAVQSELMPYFSLKLLCLLARADCDGKICEDRDDIIASNELFEETAIKLGVYETQPMFTDDYSRLAYFNKKIVDTKQSLYNPTWGDVIIMCGLPASGKDWYIKNYYAEFPVISLDDIRERLKIKPTDDQGKVVNVAMNEAKQLLRLKKSFVWNATNLTADIREKLVKTFSDYGAFVRIVYKEALYEEILKRNKERDRHVPEDVIDKMLQKIEPPRIDEAHDVNWVVF